MKKIYLCLTALLSFAYAAFTFAEPATTKGYFSIVRPGIEQSVKNALAHPPTDITIINASSSGIFVVVPNSPINDFVNFGYNDHVYNSDVNSTFTYIVLQDPFHNTFFSSNVCRLAIITVYGNQGAYRINTDSDLCQ